MSNPIDQTNHSLQIQHRDIASWLHQCIEDAITMGASDIHLEPKEHAYQVRYRVDGILIKMPDCRRPFCDRLPTRIKVIASLDISEKRRPQEGQFAHFCKDLAHLRSCRVSICPSTQGEMIVLRILSHDAEILSMDNLGMHPQQLILYHEYIIKTNGLILVVGPTGSGKSETIYSTLKFLNVPERNILTVEDPVERDIDNIRQLKIEPALGINYACALKHFLRQDPDIIMVGEIRDLDTLKMCIRASQTGHLVFSTLHATSALKALDRLRLFGLPLDALFDSLSLIVAQRLVRKICAHCKGLPLKNKPPCPCCQKGYQGRIGTFELLPFTQYLHSALRDGATLDVIADHQLSKKRLSIWDAANMHIKNKVTDMPEIERHINIPKYDTNPWMA